MDNKDRAMRLALRLVSQITLTITRMETVLELGLSIEDRKALLTTRHPGSPLSLNMVKKLSPSREDKVCRLIPTVAKMTKLATIEELPDEFVVVTEK
ncbi:ORF9b [Severe acute respiratory syndrome-related coronavirus]|uniref:Accessory protein 9b n=1 Tax=Severe acute respiratory syndrome coronavirus TaxID=694009 RepID=A0A3Q8AD31_SARS|nr:ORF9b [Severe acute respiratory syndrome-related coronavirus]